MINTIKYVLSATAIAMLAACGGETKNAAPSPAPAAKQQKVIFEVTTLSCQGDAMCQALIAMSHGTCSAMSTQLSTAMAEGWRVISSTNKEKLAGSSGPVKCVGTEYVLEK